MYTRGQAQVLRRIYDRVLPLLGVFVGERVRVACAYQQDESQSLLCYVGDLRVCKCFMIQTGYHFYGAHIEQASLHHQLSHECRYHQLFHIRTERQVVLWVVH